MEISGAVHHHRLLLGRSHKAALMRTGGGVVTTTTRVRVPARATCGGKGGAVFCDEGHRQYYEEGRSKQDKKRAKLIKTLKKDLSELYSLGFGAPSDQSDKITEAAKQLLEQLNQIKVEEEEMMKKKKKKKEEKKAACKEDSSSCSSESSESDCEEAQILKFSDIKTAATATAKVPNPVSTVPLAAPLSLLVSVNSALAPVQIVPVEEVSPVRIEVCMGGKCKKAGSMDVLQEFERQVGGEGGAVVVGCKCLGKCKEGPNVKVSNFNPGTTGTTGTVGGESVRVMKDQLCIGVGLDDVGPIVAHFLGEEEESDDAGSRTLISS